MKYTLTGNSSTFTAWASICEEGSTPYLLCYFQINFSVRKSSANPDWLRDDLLEDETLQIALSRVPEVKLIAFDLDGTLLTSDKIITERSEKVIKALSRAGIIMVPCTGRPPRNTKTYVEQLGLETAFVFNGAGLYHRPSDTTTYRHCMSKATALQIIKQMREAIPGVIAGTETSHGWYLDAGYFEWRKTQPYLPQLEPTGIGDICNVVDDTTVKIYFRKPGMTARAMSLALTGIDTYFTWSSTELLEVMAHGVNKREALTHICTELGISWQEVITFGDEHNDQGMLMWAGLGVAMFNAKREAEEAADFTTKSNDEDGVAAVLEQVLARLEQQ
jgi:Cof subfamily protein (haloacid dehalogenase superfamily)